MKITRKHLRQIINEESQRLSEEKERVSEMMEFSRSRSGKKVVAAGSKIRAASNIIAEVSADQTGGMREAMRSLSEFTAKMGEALGGMGMLQEGESMTQALPSPQELKELHKKLQRLEK
jgi:hypothetical protein